MEARVTVEMLQQHASFVRSLAERLIRDPGHAADASQAAWLACLERKAEPPQRPRAWLARVVTNEARMGWRGATRRRARETRVARPEAVPATLDDVVRAETVRRVAEAVLSLGEPYRATVLRRYYEGQPPRVIAHETGVPLETVKSRLKRAHERLRIVLEGEAPPRRPAWLAVVAAPMRPLAGIGGVLMTSKSWAAVAVLALGLVGLVAWGAGGGLAPSPTAPVAGDDALAPPSEREGKAMLSGRTRSAGDDARQPRAERTPGATTPATAAGPDTAKDETSGPVVRTYVGRVLVDGVPLRAGRVEPLGRSKAGSDVDDEGRFQIHVLEAKALHLSVRISPEHTRRVVVPVEADQQELLLELAGGSGVLEGTVYGVDGQAQVAAALQLYATGGGFEIHIRTDSYGGYRVTDLPAGHYTLVSRVPSGTPGRGSSSRSATIQLPDAGVHRLDLGSRHGDPRWSGTVRFADGSAPARSGNIFLKSVAGDRHLYVGFAKGGAFSEVVPPGTYRMEFVLSVGDNASPFPRFCMVATAHRLVIDQAPVEEELTIPGTRVEGRVRGYRAKPGPGVQLVVFERVAAEGDPAELPSLFGSSRKGVRQAQVGADGRFEMQGLPAGTWRMTGRPLALEGDAEGQVFLTIADGEAVVRPQLSLRETAGR